ncbi:MAG: hypothetical protein JWP26_3185 [Devosia sp.]|uniref:CopM family metallochaperone n=1 Tax=Devosia sp. TaxID=1871048 RepID=UPI002632DC21|nr:DUF305 domain-containing protein [Devosia sp.]MDB5588215.1 hypothetical protein [Devosia sp.]
MKPLLLASALILALVLPVAAQEMKMDHGAMATDSAATKAYKAANMDMHSAMEIDYSGDADIDFVRGMIPHHQGAIAMAKVVLEHGTDPEIKKLAQEIITAQESEIAWMQDWLTKHPAP